MEHVARAVLPERLHEALAVLHVCHIQHYVYVGELGLHLQLQVVHRGFGLVQQYYFSGAERSHLTYYLAADRAGGAGDKHGAVLQGGGNAAAVCLDYLAPQEVFDFHGVDMSRDIG